MAGDGATFSVEASAPPSVFLCLSVAAVAAWRRSGGVVAVLLCLLAAEWMCDAVISLMSGGI